MKQIWIVLTVFSCQISRAQKFENLAPLPPMGWNSWNAFQVNINEQLVKETADKMVSSGMKAAGYNYLVLDDGWMAMERDSSGSLVADPKKFPHGMKAVADYVHSLGLKFGLYNCAGTKTCAGYPGTRGYEYQDARFYASVGIDYLKFDWCNAEGLTAKEAYGTMSKALKKAGRPILFNLCEWGGHKPWEWASGIGQIWRMAGDITAQFDGIKSYGNWHANGVMTIVDLDAGLQKYAGPDHWNDPDMLEVGNGMTQTEDRTHFSIWCMLAAPLIAGNDIRKMSAEINALLINKNAIAIDQDAMGVQGFRYANQDSLQTWFKPLQGGDWAICFLNRGATPKTVLFDWQHEPVKDSVSGNSVNAGKTLYKIKNLWTGKDAGTTHAALNAVLASHDVLMLRLVKQ